MSAPIGPAGYWTPVMGQLMRLCPCTCRGQLQTWFWDKKSTCEVSRQGGLRPGLTRRDGRPSSPMQWTRRPGLRGGLLEASRRGKPGLTRQEELS
eukprot:8594915-Heterocapsa_arctica.AAC.1